MNHKEAARNYARIIECLALLDRHFAEPEQREAAKGLGLEHLLPEPEQVDIKYPQG